MTHDLSSSRAERVVMGKKRLRRKEARGSLRRAKKVRARAIALAALHINESMLLQLQAADLLSSREIANLLNDAKLTLRNAGEHVRDKSCLAASNIIELMLESYVQARP